MGKLRQTPSQTIGPFFAYSLTPQQYGYNFNSIVDGSLTNGKTTDGIVYITGKIFDGAGNPIHDAMIELWQADGNGNYNSEIEYPASGISFKGFGRLGTGTNSNYEFNFKTIKPGSVNGQVPHINVILFMRGSLRMLNTRIYFSDENNDGNELFSGLDIVRRKTLIAQREEKNGITTYHFDICMQGENETIFFEI